MKLNYALSLLAAIVYISPVYLWPGMSDMLAWVMVQVSCLLFIILLFRFTPVTEIGLRSLWAIGILYTTGEVLTDWWIPEKYLSLLIPIEFVIYASLFSWTIHRPSVYYKSDKINEEDIFIVFYKPKGFNEIIKAVIGLPFTSVSLYAGGKWLRFRHNEKGLQLLSIRPMGKRYFIVNTHEKCSTLFRSMMRDAKGIPARHWTSLYLRCRCVVAIAPLLKMIGSSWEPRAFDFIPGVYAYRKIVRNGRRRIDRG